MKHIALIFSLGLLILGTAHAQKNAGSFSKPYVLPEGLDLDKFKDAAHQAAGDVWKNYVSSVNDFKVTSFAVLPLQKDVEGDYTALQLRNQFTEVCGPQGLQLFSRVDPEWDLLLKEIAWGENYADTMDQSTVQKFGRIKGVQALVFSRITGATKTDTEGVKLRLNVQVFEVETGEQLWGKEIVTTMDGDAVRLLGPSTMRNYGQVIITGGAVLGGLLILFILMKIISKASRPR